MRFQFEAFTDVRFWFEAFMDVRFRSASGKLGLRCNWGYKVSKLADRFRPLRAPGRLKKTPRASLELLRNYGKPQNPVFLMVSLHCNYIIVITGANYW